MNDIDNLRMPTYQSPAKLAAENARLTRQRNDLLAALEELATAVKYAHLDSNRYTPGCAVCDALARSDQVVAATGQGEVGA